MKHELVEIDGVKYARCPKCRFLNSTGVCPSCLPTPPATPACEHGQIACPHAYENKVLREQVERLYAAYEDQVKNGTRITLERPPESAELASLRAQLRSVAEEVGEDPGSPAVMRDLPSIVRGTRDACEQLRAERDVLAVKLAEAEKAVETSQRRFRTAAKVAEELGQRAKDAKAKLAEWEAAGRVLAKAGVQLRGALLCDHMVQVDGAQYGTTTVALSEWEAAMSNPLASRLVAEAGGTQ